MPRQVGLAPREHALQHHLSNSHGGQQWPASITFWSLMDAYKRRMLSRWKKAGFVGANVTEVFTQEPWDRAREPWMWAVNRCKYVKFV